MTDDDLLLACLTLGVQIQDLDILTIGMMLDLIISNRNQYIDEDKKSKVRRANQSDFNNF